MIRRNDLGSVFGINWLAKKGGKDLSLDGLEAVSVMTSELSVFHMPMHANYLELNQSCTFLEIMQVKLRRE